MSAAGLAVGRILTEASRRLAAGEDSKSVADWADSEICKYMVNGVLPMPEKEDEQIQRLPDEV